MLQVLCVWRVADFRTLRIRFDGWSWQDSLISIGCQGSWRAKLCHASAWSCTQLLVYADGLGHAARHMHQTCTQPCMPHWPDFSIFTHMLHSSPRQQARAGPWQCDPGSHLPLVVVATGPLLAQPPGSVRGAAGDSLRGEALVACGVPLRPQLRAPLCQAGLPCTAPALSSGSRRILERTVQVLGGQVVCSELVRPQTLSVHVLHAGQR